ncbi:GNAT family N-acetyltransferase [Nocardioides terrisoli]|uniref:GNAT family N-acetyltransferase n=1 Tax=Nocardioides terrisoli TaxID=3388267 RepID=UPI00287B7B96|nr:GNAT family N-acetyltransferase [Nocardioides marmorisolisilvae]
MSSPIRVGIADDAQRYLATDRLVWFEEHLAAPAEDLLASMPVDQRFAALTEAADGADGADPATYPGIYGVRPMTLSVPGRGLPRALEVAGLTWVGVHPDHRRRGVLTAMLRDHFERCRAQGWSVSALHASEPAIYGRHGYGLASHELTVTLGRGTDVAAPHLDATAARIGTRWGTLADAGVADRLQASEQRAAAGVLGAIVGDLSFYAIIAREFPELQRGREPRRVMFAVQDGVDVGHAIFHRTQRWEHGRPGGKVLVRRLAGTPAARLALVRRLVDLDLTTSVQVDGVGLDDELLHWVRGPRGASEVEIFDSLWVRLVDVPRALAARSYAAPCDVVVEVDDEAAPWNTGCWRVAVDDRGTAEVTRCDRSAELRLPVRALGAAYLGGGNLATMQRAGLVEELRNGAAVELWRTMRTDSAPAAAIGF